MQDPEPLRPPWRCPYKNARRGETCTWLRAKCSCMPSRRKHGAIVLIVSTSSSSPRNPRSSGAARRSPLELKAPILYSEPYYPTAPSCTRGLPPSPASQRNAMPSAPILDPRVHSNQARDAITAPHSIARPARTCNKQFFAEHQVKGAGRQNHRFAGQKRAGARCRGTVGSRKAS